jgi:hypothetical protein
MATAEPLRSVVIVAHPARLNYDSVNVGGSKSPRSLAARQQPFPKFNFWPADTATLRARFYTTC